MIDRLLRWRIERDYQELKSEFGLGHYEGRGWRGFHHHASLCIATYAFHILERLAGRANKKPLDQRRLPYPKVGPRAARPVRMQRHVPDSVATMRWEIAREIALSLPRCPCCSRLPDRTTKT